MYLKKIRNEKHLSMQQVCNNVEITNSVLCRLEQDGIKTPDPRALNKLAKYYNLNIVDLYVKAGYIDELIEHSTAFANTDNLTSKEVLYIQQLIDLFNENKSEKR